MSWSHVPTSIPYSKFSLLEGRHCNLSISIYPEASNRASTLEYICPTLRHLCWYLCLVYSFSSTVFSLADFLNTVYLLYKNNLEISLPLCTMRWFKYHWNYIFLKIYSIILLWNHLYYYCEVVFDTFNFL